MIDIFASFRMPRTLWAEHWTNGGTGVDKLGDRPHEIAVRESVGLFADPTVFLVDGALHTSRPHPVNLSDFWQFHSDRVKGGAA